MLFPVGCGHSDSLILTKTTFSAWEKEDAAQCPCTSPASSMTQRVISRDFVNRGSAARKTRENGRQTKVPMSHVNGGYIRPRSASIALERGRSNYAKPSKQSPCDTSSRPQSGKRGHHSGRREVAQTKAPIAWGDDRVGYEGNQSGAAYTLVGNAGVELEGDLRVGDTVQQLHRERLNDRQQNALRAMCSSIALS